MKKPRQLVAVFCFFTLSVLHAWTASAEGQIQSKNETESESDSEANQISTDNRIQISGVYPHLTMRNDERECGTGAVVPWQGDLWVVTYGPHKPNGSSDKLYQITPNLNQIVFPDSVGGTPANRMIHRETNQLLIGPYLIDGQKKIRTLPPSKMYGRLTGNARHLTDPANKVYYATMEEGLYEVDLRSLAIKCLIRDGHPKAPKNGVNSKLPGYHGKGLYSGQGRLLYSNNGEKSKAAKKDPTTASGALAQWFGKGDWNLIRRNQFTEITGPGGICGSTQPDSDPIWAMGWDEKSILLGLLEEKQWHYYRLPKASHSYDGAHGWNTEWPRIREIGEDDLLATMHGTFWRFPKSFSQANSAGILPRSNYLKVIGDFCRWNDKIVLGCDDSASAEFLNTRSFKAKHAAAKQSNSNLWFVDPAKLDQLGPAIGRGNVWLVESIKAGDTSDPYLFNGYDYQQIHLNHTSATPVDFELEVDRNGTNQWEKLTTLTVAGNQAVSKIFSPVERGAWIRLRSLSDATAVTANFQYRNRDTRGRENDAMFAGVATTTDSATSFGLMRSQSADRLGIVASTKADASDSSYYELNHQMELVPSSDLTAANELVAAVAQPAGSVSVDAASVIIEEAGQRYRLPKNADYQNIESAGNQSADDNPLKKAKRGGDQWGRFGVARVRREVATERDLLNVHGTFYELPARNAQGLAKLRPIATHNLKVHDFCSHAGLLFFTGVDGQTKTERIFRSADGKAAVWAGVVDDLWKLGKPRGVGGPWKDTKVNAGETSDPYLMTAFDKKSVQLSST